MFERIVRFMNKDSPVPQEPPQAVGEISGDTLEERVISALRTVYDPEIPVNIYDLGLIYALEILDDRRVHICMTLTAPACPVAGTLPGTVAEAVKRVPGIETAEIELVWDPPWSQDRMSDEARLDLGLL